MTWHISATSHLCAMSHFSFALATDDSALWYLIIDCIQMVYDKYYTINILVLFVAFFLTIKSMLG